MRILITGGTGFIGRFLVRKLAKGRDAQIFCLVRRPAQAREKFKKYDNVELIKGDILDSTSLESLPEVDLVYHLAGKVHSKEKKGNPYYELNTEGTRFLAQAVMQSSRTYPRFVFLSSIAAVVGRNCGVVNENTPPDPVTRYGKSKLEAENILLDFKRRYGLPVIIVRAPLVYGPEDNFFSGAFLLFKMVKRRIKPVGGGKNLVSLCYVENLIFVLEKIKNLKKIPGNIYFVADDDPYPLERWIEIIARAQGVSFPFIGIPEFLADIFSKIGPHGIRKIINQMRSNWACDITRVRKELGYSPPYTPEEGIKKTISWFKERGII